MDLVKKLSIKGILFSVILAAILFVSVPVTAFAKDAEEATDNIEATVPCSGVTNGVTWSVDANYNLTATGTMGNAGQNIEIWWGWGYGDGASYKQSYYPDGYEITENECPWISVRDKIVTAKISVKNAYGILTWFDSSPSLTSVDFTGTDLGEHKSLAMLFYGCKKLRKVTFSDSFDTSNVLSMWRMFRSCQNLREINGFEYFNTSKVTDFKEMFFDCSYIEKIDLSTFDASSAESIDHIVNSCYNLTDFKFFKKGTTKNIYSAAVMFGACTSLKHIDLSGHDLSSLQRLNGTFKACKALESIDFSNTNLKYVEMLSKDDDIFFQCNNLKSVSFKGANLEGVESIDEFFAGCPKLQLVDMTDCKLPYLKNVVFDKYDEDESWKEGFPVIFSKDCTNIKEFRTPYGFNYDILFGDNYKGTGTVKFKDETGKEYSKLTAPLEKSIVLKRDGGYTGSTGGSEPGKPATPSVPVNADLGEVVFSTENKDTSTKAANGVIVARITKPNQTYNGKELKPTVSVIYKYNMYDSNGALTGKAKNKKLKKDTDYSISYENNIDASENGAYVVLEGMGNYKGTIKLPFTIKKRAAKFLSMDVIPDVALSSEEFNALNDGDSAKSGAVQEKVFELINKSVSENTVVYDGARTISGNQYSYEISPVKVKKNVKSVVVQIVENKDAKDVANYTFEKGAVKAKTTVYLADETTKSDISECTLSFTTVKPYVFNGRLIKPKVVVKGKDGKKLAAKNYKVLYRNNVNPGTATVYVVGKGNYIGISSSLTFKIDEKK